MSQGAQSYEFSKLCAQFLLCPSTKVYSFTEECSGCTLSSKNFTCSGLALSVVAKSCARLDNKCLKISPSTLAPPNNPYKTHLPSTASDFAFCSQNDAPTGSSIRFIPFPEKVMSQLRMDFQLWCNNAPKINHSYHTTKIAQWEDFEYLSFQSSIKTL